MVCSSPKKTSQKSQHMVCMVYMYIYMYFLPSSYLVLFCFLYHHFFLVVIYGMTYNNIFFFFVCVYVIFLFSPVSTSSRKKNKVYTHTKQHTYIYIFPLSYSCVCTRPIFLDRDGGGGGWVGGDTHGFVVVVLSFHFLVFLLLLVCVFWVSSFRYICIYSCFFSANIYIYIYTKTKPNQQPTKATKQSHKKFFFLPIFRFILHILFLFVIPFIRSSSCFHCTIS